MTKNYFFICVFLMSFSAFCQKIVIVDENNNAINNLQVRQHFCRNPTSLKKTCVCAHFLSFPGPLLG